MRRSRILAGAVAVGAVLLTPTAAVAQYVTTDTPRVRGETETRPETKVLGQTTSRSGSLAVTGGDILGMAAIGAGAIGVGTVLVRRGRTRSTATA